MGMASALSEARQRARLATPGSGTLVAAIAVTSAAVMAALGSIMSGVFDQPTWLDPPSAIVAFYHGSSPEWRVAGAFLVGLAFLLLLVFVAKLADLIAAVDPPSAWLGRSILAVAAVDTAVVLVNVAALSAPIWRAAHGDLSSEGFVIMNDVQFAFGMLSLVVSAGWAITLGSAIVRTMLLPRWLGWALRADAAVFLLAVASPVLVWDLAYGLLLVILVVAGLLILLGRHRAVPSASGVVQATGS